MINHLGKTNSVFNHFMAEMRDGQIQQDPMRFRRNLERIGEIMAYEISKQLRYATHEIVTPLGTANVPLIEDKVVIASILRAGIPMHEGFLNFFDKAENCFISAYRKYSKDGSFKIKLEYKSCPSIDGKVVILADAMLATGSSFELAYRSLMDEGNPRHVHLASAIASKQGVGYLRKHLPMQSVSLWLGAIDDELTSKSYIVPGLGDAGDLAYGSKVKDEDEEE